MSRTERQWSINGDFTVLSPTGVARYAGEVTRAIDALIGEGHPLTRDLRIELVVPRENSALRLDNIPVRVVREFKHPRLPQVWVQLQLPRAIQGGLISLCNLAPAFYRKQIACIHDLQTVLVPQSYGVLFRLAHRMILPALGRHAARITTVSQFSKENLIRHGIAPAEKISVTYNGSGHALNWRPERSQLTIGQRPFVLFLGQAQPHKNADLVWRIAPELDAQGLDVYVAGNLDADAVARLAPAVPGNIRLLGRVTDDDLAKLMASAACFLFPSRIEGFGLPAVEAMARGCPVVASSAPCMPEVCADGALFAAPDDAGQWLAQVMRIVRDPALRSDLIRAGRERAATFHWRRIAEHYLNLMWEVDGRLLSDVAGTPGAQNHADAVRPSQAARLALSARSVREGRGLS